MRSIHIAIISITASMLISAQTTTTRTTWSGTLIDAGCYTTKETVRTDTPGRVARTETTVTTDCPASTTTNTFGLVTSDGRFIRFDNPSNTRVVEIIRNNRGWDRYLTERTPMRVRVMGTANGDVAVVESLDLGEARGEVSQVASDVVFDVRHHDDRGKLIVTSRGVNFENISNSKRSRSWTYSQIKELKRDGREIKIEPHSGDEVEFKFDGRAMSDTVYNTIADRIVAARSR